MIQIRQPDLSDRYQTSRVGQCLYILRALLHAERRYGEIPALPDLPLYDCVYMLGRKLGK
jgi:hypothetical protein